MPELSRADLPRPPPYVVTSDVLAMGLGTTSLDSEVPTPGLDDFWIDAANRDEGCGAAANKSDVDLHLAQRAAYSQRERPQP
jgi:hypothetical protein